MTWFSLLVALVASAIGSLAGAFLTTPDFRQWCFGKLIGTRTRYWIDLDGDLRKTGESTLPYKEEIKRVAGPSVQINQGLFRRPSAIYVTTSDSWKLAKVLIGDVSLDESKLLLTDSRGNLSIESALRLFACYGSIHEMLNSIAGLETELVRIRQQASDNKKEAQIVASAIQAIMQRLPDKQRGRSPLVAGIRMDLENVWAMLDTPPIKVETDRWTKFLKDREKPVA